MQNTVWAIIRLTSPLCMPIGGEEHQRGDGDDDLGHHQRQGDQHGDGAAADEAAAALQRQGAGHGDDGRGDGGDHGDDQAVQRRVPDVVVRARS